MRKLISAIVLLLLVAGCGAETTNKTVGCCELSVNCEAVLDSEKLSSEKKDIIPENGIIFQGDSVEIYEGENAFDLLLRTMKENNIHIEFSKSPAYNAVYIEGISNLYQMDCGDMSGWLYRINGEIPVKALSELTPTDGDVIEIFYSCDFTEDT